MPGLSEPGTIVLEEGEESDQTHDDLEQAQFDPVQYLNDHLPNPVFSSQSSNAKQDRSNQLQTASSDVQSFLSKISAHNVRTSTELTTLTDGILRSGSRLAYEVELLRGDANNLHELLTDVLQNDISKFVLGGLSDQEYEADADSRSQQNDPDFILQLRMLGQIKSRLEAVVSVFGEAMKWPVPPSDVSMASNLISVSAPELGVVSTAEDDKARETIKGFRMQISELLESDGGGYAGLEAASNRVEEFKKLAVVWRGTMEERARNRIVDGFAKLVDDRRRGLDAKKAPPRPNADGARPGSAPSRMSNQSVPGASLFRNLQKLRDEIYLD